MRIKSQISKKPSFKKRIKGANFNQKDSLSPHALIKSEVNSPRVRFLNSKLQIKGMSPNLVSSKSNLPQKKRDNYSSLMYSADFGNHKISN